MLTEALTWLVAVVAEHDCGDTEMLKLEVTIRC